MNKLKTGEASACKKLYPETTVQKPSVEKHFWKKLQNWQEDTNDGVLSLFFIKNCRYFPVRFENILEQQNCRTFKGGYFYVLHLFTEI